MAGMSDYLEVAIRKHIFKDTAYSKPTVLAIALFTADPTDANITANEVANANGYARVTVNPSSSANWTEGSSTDGSVSNTNNITFPTATGSWGTITHVGIYDSATYGAGNLLFSAALTSSKTIGNTDVFVFNAGDLVTTFD